MIYCILLTAFLLVRHFVFYTHARYSQQSTCLQFSTTSWVAMVSWIASNCLWGWTSGLFLMVNRVRELYSLALYAVRHVREARLSSLAFVSKRVCLHYQYTSTRFVSKHATVFTWCVCTVVGQYCIFDRPWAALWSIAQACVSTHPGLLSGWSPWRVRQPWLFCNKLKTLEANIVQGWKVRFIYLI